MNKRTVIIVVLLAAAVGLLWVFFWKQPSPPVKVKAPVAAPQPSASEQVVKRKNEWQGTDQQIPKLAPGAMNQQSPEAQEYMRRTFEDKSWEWKTPIAFYGCVLDQNNSPVTRAKVVLSWTDLSAKGTSVRELQTDGAGNFTLSGERGKHLLVRSIEKVGYEYATTNRDGFEYSAFFEEEYHIPDPNNPVIFRMHKKMAAEPLIKLSNEIKIPSSGAVGINLQNGRIGEAEAHLVIEFVNNSDPTGRKWVARVLAPGGSLQPANDEFARVAPENGYMSEITIDQDTSQPGGFQSGSLYKGGKFYVKTSAGYALVEFRMVPGNNDFRFSSYLNPNTNSRNLEYDPAFKVNIKKGTGR